MRMTLVAAALLIVPLSATSAIAGDIPKFGKTCVGNSGQSSSICLTSNGTTVSSTYLFRGKIRTSGSHTGCSTKGSSIKCSGGTYRTSQGSGKMNPVTVKISNGKPASISWR